MMNRTEVPSLSQVLAIRKHSENVFFYVFIESSPAAQFPFYVRRHPLVDVACAGLFAENLACAGDFESTGSCLVGLHFRHVSIPFLTPEFIRLELSQRANLPTGVGETPIIVLQRTKLRALLYGA